MELIITDADGFHAAASGSPLAVMSFSRREVLAGQTGDALDRLMNFTDSREQSTRFASAIVLHFDGFDDDGRELYEIPEVSRFFRALTDNWAAWYHFLAKEPTVQQFPLVFALLCDVAVIRREGQVATRFRSQDQVRHVEQRLERAATALYQHHGWPQGQLAETISAAQRLAFGE